MKPSLTVLTLTVENLEKAVAFYHDGMGLKTEGIIGTEFEYGAVAFFELQKGLKLGLWPRKSLAHDSGLPVSQAGSPGFSLGHNVSSESEVDQVMQQAEAAGAVMVKAAQKTFYGGYAGYFQDLDGHLWEVVWNPHFEPA